MQHLNLALLGFGNVGQALARLLSIKAEEIRDRYGITYSVTGIYTGRHGSAIDPKGIDLQGVLDGIAAGAPLDDFSAVPAMNNAIDFIRQVPADVLFENTPVNYATGQPAIDHLRTALDLGMHAITANKGPVVHAYRELTQLAQDHGVRFFFESTVMDGAPIFSLFRGSLPGVRLQRFQGVLNSTTNMILTRMEAGESFDEAVGFCQRIGLAETDPSGDIDGWDASVKVAALATVLMDVPLKPQEVNRQGIRQITPDMVRKARENGQRWKLVCTCERDGDGVRARVAPELVGLESPMYGVEGSTSIVQFETDVLGLLSVIESDPGPHTTAYGLFADFLNAVR